MFRVDSFSLQFSPPSLEMCEWWKIRSMTTSAKAESPIATGHRGSQPIGRYVVIGTRKIEAFPRPLWGDLMDLLILQFRAGHPVTG